MEFLFRLASRLPLPVLHALGWLGGWLVFLASSAYRRRFLDNAAQAGVGAAQWLRAVGQGGMMVSELPRVWLGQTVPVTLEGEAHVLAALDGGQGVLCLTPHLGCFEITGRAYAERFCQSGAPITVLYRPPRQAWLRNLVIAARNRPGLRAVPTDLQGVKQMIKALRAGQAVGLLPDQVPPMGLGRSSRFFGRAAYTMTLSARLAQQTGARVLLVWGERVAWGRGYRVHFEPMAEALSDDLDAAVLQVNAAMEALILRQPGQYLWGYARYKLPRGAAQSGAQPGAKAD